MPMELNRIYTDNDFNNVDVPSGQRFLFLGYDTGEIGGNVVIRYKDSNNQFGNIASGSELVDGDQSIDEASYFVTTNSDNYEIQVGVEHIGGISIVWGDGEVQTISGSASMNTYNHTYESAGTYKVIITGNISRISYANNNTTMGALIDSIESFPNKTITSLKNTFARCSKITRIPSNVTTDGISDLYGFCRDCEELRNLPNKFYLSNTIEDASYAFSNCKKLRWNISDVFNWHSGTKNVTSMLVNCENIYGLPDDKVLWNSEDIVFSATSNAFTNTPAAIKKYAPQSWGGGSESGDETPDISEIAEQLDDVENQLSTI